MPSGVYNLGAILDKLDDNPRWDQVCTLREAQSATGSREMLSGLGRGNLEVGVGLMDRISRNVRKFWKRTI